MKKWLKAFRLRTLPLALSSIILGSFLAYTYREHSWLITILAIITTIFLQILSNLANDYGDAKKGVDNTDRIGPERSIQSGEISFKQMKTAIYVFMILSLASGLSLVLIAAEEMDLGFTLFFILLGIAAIGAALKYTIGKNPYGYYGFGDLFVYIFFGLTGVMGTFYLHTNDLPWQVILPASTLGLFSVAVLNLNNMRDRINDEKSGKRTLVVAMGIEKARVYHTVLIIGGLTSSIIFTLIYYFDIFQLIYLIILPILLNNIKVVWQHENPKTLDPELKKIALGTLLYSVTFGIGLLLAYA